jgi:putative ABC transport system permease protein
MMNNIMLLAMGLGVIFMINNFSTAVGTAVTDVYAKGKMDAQADGGNFDDDFISKVNKVDGVEHTYFTKNAPNITANNSSIKLMYVIGIDGGDYCNYAFDEFGKYMTDDLVRQLKNERSILITRFTAKKYDLSVGDILKIDFNHKKVDYKVAGIVTSVINNGNMNFVYEKYLTEDAGIKNYQRMYLNIRDNADTKQVLENIRELLPNQILPIQTLKEMQDQNVKSNNIVFYMMKAISIIAMFIGIIGIFNNFMICFISRRKLYASMRSLGLSKSRTVWNMLSEAFCCGLLGTISGMLLGTVLFKAMCYVIEAMGITSEIAFYNVKDYIFVLASGIIISLISAIFPALRISRENIVSGLKYE